MQYSISYIAAHNSHTFHPEINMSPAINTVLHAACHFYASS